MLLRRHESFLLRFIWTGPLASAEPTHVRGMSTQEFRPRKEGARWRRLAMSRELEPGFLPWLPRRSFCTLGCDVIFNEIRILILLLSSAKWERRAGKRLEHPGVCRRSSNGRLAQITLRAKAVVESCLRTSRKGGLSDHQIPSWFRSDFVWEICQVRPSRREARGSELRL